MGILVLSNLVGVVAPTPHPSRQRRTTTTSPPLLSLSLSPPSSSLKPIATSASSFAPFSSLRPLVAGEQSPRSPEEMVRDSAAYEEVLDCLSSLITKRTHGDGSNRGNCFDLMDLYLNMLDLEEAVAGLKVIHVAGTKGKGSTCSFAESILRSCGFRTGLFTSPHLIDIRERFKLDGVEISEEKFLKYFWWCWDRLKDKTADSDVPMPTFFRFLALLAFKIFSAEQVDVTILEVGLGGRYDATNVVKTPIVCGVASLGYDHMEILGNTLGQIAFEKAGIFKEGVPAYTVPQPEEAMSVLERRASQLGISLSVALPLDIISLNGQKLGLDGDHQYLNAGLAVALCHTWLKRTGLDMNKGICVEESLSLPEQFISGLERTGLSGRAQIVPDLQFSTKNHGHHSIGGLSFYLDGAHSPESMDVCAKWFSRAIKDDMNEECAEDNYKAKQILLFNCMSVRDPQLLLPRLFSSCANHGIHFHKALFAPNQSLYYKVGSYATPAEDPETEVSWQHKLQKVWESVAHVDKSSKIYDSADGDTKHMNHSSMKCQESSAVFCSLPLAVKWLRDMAYENRSCRFQVLVTGSLHLVGDVLRLIKK